MSEEALPQEVVVAPAPAAKKMSRKVLLIAVGGLVAIVAVVVGLSFAGSGSKDLTVTFSLLDFAGSSTCDGGTGGYSDIGPGTAVVVRDDGSHILGTAQLGDGKHSAIPRPSDVPDGLGGGGCVWQTTIKGVPTGKKFYSVEVGHRGSQVYSVDQLKKSNWIVDVSLGGS